MNAEVIEQIGMLCVISCLLCNFRKIREKLDKFKQRKLESQREMSISTICNDAGGGDYEERYIM